MFVGLYTVSLTCLCFSLAPNNAAMNLYSLFVSCINYYREQTEAPFCSMGYWQVRASSLMLMFTIQAVLKMIVRARGMYPTGAKAAKKNN